MTTRVARIVSGLVLVCIVALLVCRQTQKRYERRAALPGGSVRCLSFVSINHRDGVYTVAFDPSGKFVASAGDVVREDGAVKVWNAATGQLCSVFPGQRRWITTLAFGDNEQTLLAASKSFVFRWDQAAPQQANVVALARYTHLNDVLAPGGGLLGYTETGRTARVLDLRTGNERIVYSDSDKDVLSIAFSADGGSIAVGGLGTLCVVDLATGKERASYSSPDRTAAYAVALSPDGTTAAVVTNSRQIRILDVATGQVRGLCSAHFDQVTCLAFSPDGKALASGSRDCTVRLWDVATGEERACLEGHRDTVQAVAFAPSGDRIASGSIDQTVRIWQLSVAFADTRSGSPGPAGSIELPNPEA